MSAAAWPPQLKDWVAKCLQDMTEANKDAAQTELKAIIAKAYAEQKLWTIEWSTMQLESLKPKSFKRKSGDVGVANLANGKKSKKSAMATTLLGSETDERLQKRARRFEREHEIERQKAAGISTSSSNYSPHVNNSLGGIGAGLSLADRMSGLTTSSSFELRPGKGHSRRKYMNSSMGYEEPEGLHDPNVIDWDRFTIVGRSEKLFKNYLRLTSEPDPRDVRPYQILQQTLAELKKRWKAEQNYVWICDQLKSLRQDLTVQRIKNEFTVQVYEIHARMALESADLVEYNQCQSSLRHLYELGIPGKSEEFLAYRILYMLYTRNRSDLNRLISTLTPQVKANPAVRHALDVQAALATNNYHALFVLFLNAPNMGAYIMDHFIQRERVSALAIMTKAYSTIPLSFVTKELAFNDATQAHQFLTEHNAAFYSSNRSTPSSNTTTGTAKEPISDADKNIDCKAAHRVLLELLETKYRRVDIKGTI